MKQPREMTMTDGMIIRAEIEDLLGAEAGATDLEIRLVEALRRRLVDGCGYLTDNQIQALHAIWSRRVGGLR